MKTRFLMILFAAFFMFLSTAHAVTKPSRPCQMSDLQGTWRMKSAGGPAKIDKNDPFFWPHQVFVFGKDGHVKEMASDKPIDLPAIKKLESAAATSSYTLNEKGILSISKIERPAPEKCACLFMTDDMPEKPGVQVAEDKRARLPMKGNAVLTYFGKGGRPVLSKTLQKLS